MEPSVAVDAQGFPGILLQFGRTMDGFQKWKKACSQSEQGRPTGPQRVIYRKCPSWMSEGESWEVGYNDSPRAVSTPESKRRLDDE